MHNARKKKYYIRLHQIWLYVVFLKPPTGLKLTGSVNGARTTILL